MFITKNLRLFNLTSIEAALLKGLVDIYNKGGSSKSKWVSLTHDKTTNIWGTDLEALLKEELVILCNSKYEEDTGSFLSDLKINKNKLKEIENHFKVISFHKCPITQNNHNTLIYINDISDLVFGIIERAWLF